MKSLKQFFGLALVALLTFSFSMLAFAEITPVPDGDLVALIGKLVTEWKVLGPVGAGILIVMLLAQGIKQLVPDTFKFKRLLVLVLAIVYMTLVSISAGVGILPAILGVLLTSGGAMALYEALKGAGVIKKA